MKILLVGDYSGIHATLRTGLRRLGHSVTLVSDGGAYMRTAADIKVARGGGMFGSVKYLSDLFRCLWSLKGYDVVQLINSHFVDLRPEKIKYFFDRLASRNGSVYLTLCSNDYFYVKAMLDGKTYRYSEAKVGGVSTDYYRTYPVAFDGWQRDDVRRFDEYVYERIDGAVSVLPEYHIAAEPILGDRLYYGGIPIDLDLHPYRQPEISGKVKIFLGYKEEIMMKKGTDKLQRLMRELAAEMPDRCELTEVNNLPFTEYIGRMREGHIVVDQLYAYAPATNALNAMALGRVAASGGEPEYYEMIGEPVRRPIIPLRPMDCDVKAVMREYILDPERLVRMSREGRDFVERYNDATVVAQKFVDAWERRR